MSRAVRIDAGLIALQNRASDPAVSVWVAANAGAGKTHVLTERVVRLLLAGVSPDAILCLTYTKAAAAEMRRRVAGRLGRWATLSEAGLAGELNGLEPGRVDAEMLLVARTLFARALETPGGLKIVTIHAFCESVLHRFPVEARVPFDFAVIEDHEREAMVLAAREAVLAEGLAGRGAVSDAVLTLFERLTDQQIKGAIDAALADSRRLRPVLARRNEARTHLRRLVGDGPDVAGIEAEMVSGRLFGPAEISRLLSILAPRGGGKRFEDRLYALDPEAPALDDWLGAFLTQKHEPLKALSAKAFAAAAPDLSDLACREAERLASLCADRRRALLVERSEALLAVLGAIADRYEAGKRARSLLDFDDLVAKLSALFADGALADWVKYKLDAAITHILVDESQDTNPEQWRVVRDIADEFFSGEGAVTRPRTLFAVGDEKQSIYSFQGADPKLFVEAGLTYARRAAEAGRAFAEVELKTSFRTLPGVLEAVDRVFAGPEQQAAVLARRPVRHVSARAEPGGLVALWPPIQQKAPESDGSWPESPPESLASAPRQIARRIALAVKGWVEARRPLGGRGRAVAHDDVLVLVQARNALFHEIIRALRQEGIPTPGADRLAVTGHIAVKDLLALGDVLLEPADDLQLAALLRSPLFDVSEDELMAILMDRPPGRSAWAALAASEIATAGAAAARLADWRKRLDFDRPYGFFAEVLYAEGGLKRFHARLGAEVDDVLAEFLDLALAHERAPQPSLQGFLAAVRAREITIRRELAEAGGGVRVMTVHGAKGLEAPIVILADAASRPGPTQLAQSVFLIPEAPGPLLVHAGAAADHVPESQALKSAADERQREEYWRKLYVAMTRAEDELYITGALTPGIEAGRQLEGSWYAAVEAALGPEARRETRDGVPEALVFPAGQPAPAPVAAEEPSEPEARPAPLVLAPLPAMAPLTVISPSLAGAAHAAPLASALEVATGAAPGDYARRQGVALHALLQHLPGIAPPARAVVARRALSTLLPDLPERHEAIAGKALSILSRPELGFLFGPGSRAEIAFLAAGTREGAPVRIAGRIDRLVVDARAVLVVDYKSDAAPPGDSRDVPAGYLTQLGLYALLAGQLFPGRAVATAILWTSMESLMNLPLDAVLSAAGGFTVE